MHKYVLKIPWWIRWLFPSYLWKMPSRSKCVYLTFDDGPHPEITPWVLRLLKQYEARASFFCIGSNVEKYPDVYQQMIDAGHVTGNHTYSHYNGWKTPDAEYIADVIKAGTVINSRLFRPPYGRIKRRQARKLVQMSGMKEMKVVMWHVLSADFDTSVKPEECADIVLSRVEPGSIVVFHDSEKAFPNLRYALPVVLERLQKEGYCFAALEGA